MPVARVEAAYAALPVDDGGAASKARPIGAEAGWVSPVLQHRIWAVCFSTDARQSITLSSTAFGLGLVLGLSVPETGIATLPRGFQVASNIMGWTYFVAWLLSFLPQLALNHVRRSVIGMSFNSVLLGTLGFVCYMVYTVALYWVPLVRQQYADANGGSRPPVTAPDVFFCIWAVGLELVAIGQIIAFDRGQQTVSRVTLATAAALVALIIIFLSMPAAVPPGHEWASWPRALTAVSYIKIAVTLIRYLPQIHLNAIRRSTVGFNITSVVLDAIGGTLSLGQLLMDCGASHDWSGIAGDPVKFGLGVVTLIYDAIYLIQYAMFDKQQAVRGDAVPDVK